MIRSPYRDVPVDVMRSAGNQRQSKGGDTMDRLDRQHHHLDTESTDETEEGAEVAMDTDESMTETSE
jgi:hypothetical protein